MRDFTIREADFGRSNKFGDKRRAGCSEFERIFGETKDGPELDK